MVSLADLIRAAYALRSDEAECRQIAELLGLAPHPPTPAPHPPNIEATSRETKADPSPKVKTASPKPTTPAIDGRVNRPPARQASRDTVELVLSPERRGVPAFLPGKLETVPKAAPPSLALPPGLSLLSPRSSRNIVAAIVATDMPDGPLNVVQLVDILARGRPIEYLPRRLVPTLRRGAQVLIDHTESMEPFRLDVEQILAVIDRVVGESRRTLLGFEGDPREPFRWRDGKPCRYEPPSAGAPVIAVTDLTTRRPWEHEVWLRFAQIVGRAGCPLVALVPYLPTRWPRQLAQRIRIIPWERTTTVGMARRIAQDRR